MARINGGFFLRRKIGMVFRVLVLLGLAGCATTPAPLSTNPPGAVEPSGIRERWGIDNVRIQLTAASNILDFRYRVIDPDKALPILDHKVKPYLVDQKSGAKFEVPMPPKIGSLRQTARSGAPKAGKTYFILFSNPGRSVEAGDKVTVVIGDFRAENLIVR